jgi:hypothetical protein
MNRMIVTELNEMFPCQLLISVKTEIDMQNSWVRMRFLGQHPTNPSLKLRSITTFGSVFSEGLTR